MSPILSHRLPFTLTNGNDGRGSKWYKSANARKAFESDLRKLRLTRKPFPFSVSVHVTRILGKNQRLWDSSSIGRGNYKELEDALVACGWFHDDSPQWITETIFKQNANERNNGAGIEIEIYKAL